MMAVGRDTRRQALTTAHASPALGSDLALQCLSDTATFAGLKESTSTATFTATPFDAPSSWVILTRSVLTQMVCGTLRDVPPLDVQFMGPEDIT